MLKKLLMSDKVCQGEKVPRTVTALRILHTSRRAVFIRNIIILLLVEEYSSYKE